VVAAFPERWLVAHHGVIYTLDEARPRAQALLARDGRILHAGSDDEVRRLAPSDRCRWIDLGGRCVLPAFIDSHIHLLALGANLDRVALSGVASLEAVQQRVAAAARAAHPGEWVLGWGWDHSLWPGGRLPDRTLLDHVAPDVPVALRRKDGHLVWVNSAALAAARIRRETPDPPGGRIGRFPDGEPNGLLFETAIDLIDRAIPEMTEAQAVRALQRAIAELHRVGVLGAHIPEGPLTLRALQRLDQAGQLQLRATVMLAYRSLDAALQTGLRTGFGGGRLRIGPVKIFADGSLGSETAAMLEPFEGQPHNRGIMILSEKELQEAVARAAQGGLACAIHAIGDRANRVVLDAFEATRTDWQPAGLRQRIEHVQLLHPDDVGRLAALGVIASMQPIHATQDMELVDRLWGKRGRYAYAFRSLLDRGTAIAFGSDAPVESADPLAGIYAAVTRRRADGTPSGGWHPEERISLIDAVRAYTAGAAWAAGDEGRLGSLAPRKRADFVVLSHDIMASPPEVIPETRVVCSVFDGEVVYSTIPAGE
jgi:predicted amidohydrolase YtcJ